MNAAHNARFLFGADVADRTMALNAALERFSILRAEERMYPETVADRLAANEAVKAEVRAFYDEFPALCAPYMRMAQKL